MWSKDGAMGSFPNGNKKRLILEIKSNLADPLVTCSCLCHRVSVCLKPMVSGSRCASVRPGGGPGHRTVSSRLTRLIGSVRPVCGDDLPFGRRLLSASVTGLREALLLIAERSTAVRGSRAIRPEHLDRKEKERKEKRFSASPD